jgi:hypothetical protein
MELDEVEPLGAQALQRAVDDARHIGLGDARQAVEVRHEFRMDPDAIKRFGAAHVPVTLTKRTDQILDTGIDIGAVEAGDAGIGEGDHVQDRLGRADVAMAASHLPATTDDARHLVVRRQSRALHHCPVKVAEGEPPWSPRG